MSTVRFMMLMPWGRVGSNLLFDILRQSAPMKLNNEKFNQLPTAQEQIDWLNEFYESGADIASKPYIGSKQNLMAVRDMPALADVLSRNGVRVVRLRRDNFLKSAVSQIRAEQYAEKTGRETGTKLWAVKKGAEGLGPSHIDPKILVQRMEVMESLHAKLMSALPHDAVLDIEYEEVNSSLDAVVKRLRAYLDVPEKAYAVPYDKATPDDLSGAILNYSEIRAHVQGTRFAAQCGA
jgi:LPS sulfotransferase NodH